jgi:hypothetical protein
MIQTLETVQDNRKTVVYLNSEEVTVLAGHRVLIKVDENGVLIIGNPQGIFGWQLTPAPIHLLNIFCYYINY